MAEQKKQEPKAKLDSDDILSELGLSEEKAEIDSEGLTDTPDFDDKAVLDTEGILDEEIPQELEVPRKPPPVEKKEEPVAQQEAAPRKAGFPLERLRQLPWIKIGALGGGTLVLFCAGWLLLSLILSPEPPQSDNADQDTMTAALEEGQEAQEDTEELTLELEPFVIPVADAKKQTSFLRICIVLRAQHNAGDAINREATSIRSTIYNLLSHKDSRDILDDAQQESMRQELLKLLNSLLKQELILSVNFSRILLV